LSLAHDALAQLVFGAQEEAGGGYKLVKSERTSLQAEVGLGLREELFEDGSVDIGLIGTLGVRFWRRLSARSELNSSFVFFPDLIQLGDYRLEGEASLTSRINRHFLLRLSLIDYYNSTPQIGVEKNDLTVLSSIIWQY
jgi:putative salt-induced outer membrane protein YdiY